MSDPNRSTPSAVRAIITTHGGTNPNGGPMWRLVLSSDRQSKKRGVWHTFPDGTIEQVVRGPNGEFLHNPLQAVRVEYGVRETQTYAVSGWIMERWFPPEVWGAKNEWDADWGPYPEQGDYVMLGGPFDQMPELGDICKAIDVWKYEFDHRPRDLNAAYGVFVQQERDEEERQAEELEKELRALYLGEIKPIFNSTSLEAQRVRNEVQSTLGESSHLGAGQ